MDRIILLLIKANHLSLASKLVMSVAVLSSMRPASRIGGAELKNCSQSCQGLRITKELFVQGGVRDKPSH